MATIEDSFAISAIANRYGCLISFRFVEQEGRVRVRDEIQLRTPDGRVKDTYIAAIERSTYKHDVPAEKRLPGVALPPDITKQDVPAGTEIWVADKASGE